MADNRPQNPREAYGSSYSRSESCKGDTSRQVHYDSKGNELGRSETTKSGTTYYDSRGNEIRDKQK